MANGNEKDLLQEQVYWQRLTVNRLRREVFQQADPSQPTALIERLKNEEAKLSDLESQLHGIQPSDPTTGSLVNTQRSAPLVLGAESTGLAAQIYLRMAQVPTAIYHLLKAEQSPLVSCWVKNCATKGPIRRVRVTSYIDGYSARAVNTFELPPSIEYTFNQLPTLFPDRIRDLDELTRASLNLVVEDLDTQHTEIHETKPIWMLARNAAPLAVKDPKTDVWQDLSIYFGAFVTPNAPVILEFLRLAVNHHPEGRLIGYQINAGQVESQVKALYDALQTEAAIKYVNSLITFTPEAGLSNQRVRLPRESLKDKEANCIDGTVLFASLLEAVSLSPGIVLVPGHAFVAWETWRESPSQWKFLETTMIGSSSFEEACASAEKTAATYQQLATSTKDPTAFRLLPVHYLRTKLGITPME